MNITFLIGNGFDIGLGLKTRFSDFYRVYCKKESNDSCLFDFKNKIWMNINDWADFETSFGEYAKNFMPSEVDEYLKQFEDFSVTFDEYIKEQESYFYPYDEKDIMSKMDNAITTYYAIRPDDTKAIEAIYNVHKNEVKQHNFICFNYTDCLDQCLSILRNTYKKINSSSTIGNVIHVHGYADKDIIMGVNDSSQIFNQNFANNPRIINKIIKPNVNREIKMGYDALATQKIVSSDIICIYGMSLGETDKKWWQLIAKWLKEIGNRHLIILSYHSKKRINNTFQWIDSKDNVIRKFLSYTDYSDKDMETIYDRIHIGLNHNIFEMKITAQIDQNGMTTLTIK